MPPVSIPAKASAAVAASFFVGGSKGGLPMIALLSVPTMSLVMDPMKGAALLLPVYIVSDAYGVWIYRRSYSRRNLLILVPATAIGIFAGYLLAGRTDADAVRVVIGVIGLSFLVMRMRARMLGGAAPRPAHSVLDHRAAAPDITVAKPSDRCYA